jgi:coenzyme F420-reducing hydrogenase delta subunit
MVTTTSAPEVIEVNKDYCSKCRVCISLCPFDAIALDSEKQDVKLDLGKCQVCGICYTSCPAGAIDSLYFDLSGLEKYMKDGIKRFNSKTLSIACRGSVTDNEKLKELVGQKDFIPLWLPCLGRTPVELIMLALSVGIEKIMLLPCKEDFCRFEDGSKMLTSKTVLLSTLLRQLGYGKDVLTVIKYAPNITLNKDKCVRCATCFSICPYDAVKLEASGTFEIDTELCHRCGRCVSYCPAFAIEMEGSTDPSILMAIDELSSEDCRDGVLVFKCMWSQFDPNLDGSPAKGKFTFVNLPCTGRVDVIHVLEAYRKGFDTVVVAGCEEDSCKLERGSEDAKRKIGALKETLEKMGVKKRLEFHLTTPKSLDELNGYIGSLCVESDKTKG